MEQKTKIKREEQIKHIIEAIEADEDFIFLSRPTDGKTFMCLNTTPAQTAKMLFDANLMSPKFRYTFFKMIEFLSESSKQINIISEKEHSEFCTTLYVFKKQIEKCGNL